MFADVRSLYCSPATVGCRKSSRIVIRCLLQTERSVTVKGHRIHILEFSPSPEQRATPKTLPLLVLHGGPGVPSDYLQPIGARFASKGRPVCFFDQIGCGRSDAPPWLRADAPEGSQAGAYEYGIGSSVAEVAAVLAALRRENPLVWGGGFHLLGQSWGGILAMEYCAAAARSAAPPAPAATARDATPGAPAALVVANTPADVAALHAEVDRLAAALPPAEMAAMRDPAAPGHAAAVALFYSRHRCRALPEPGCIAEAYSRAGSGWRGMGVIKDWSVGAMAGCALAEGGAWPRGMRTLLLSGEHDFVTPGCVAPLEKALPAARWALLAGTSHMSHLEDEAAFDGELGAFLEQADGEWAHSFSSHLEG